MLYILVHGCLWLRTYVHFLYSTLVLQCGYPADVTETREKIKETVRWWKLSNLYLQPHCPIVPPTLPPPLWGASWVTRAQGCTLKMAIVEPCENLSRNASSHAAFLIKETYQVQKTFLDLLTYWSDGRTLMGLVHKKESKYFDKKWIILVLIKIFSCFLNCRPAPLISYL